MTVRATTQQLYDAGPEAVEAVLLALEARLEALTARVEQLEARLAKDSHNSSRPPSSDPPWQPKPPPRSLRERTDRRSGGQPGHRGCTLAPVDTPDEVVVHRPAACHHCGGALDDAPALDSVRAQVFELPPLALRVTEHQAQRVGCPQCGTRCTAALPDGLRAGTQWGPRLLGFALYLDEYQLQSLDRVQQLLRDLWGRAPSQGTLVRLREAGEEALAPVTAALKEALVRADVVHFDETGVRVAGRGEWVHVASTPELTYYAHHARRGRAAWADLDILPRFGGTSVHDGLPWYFDPSYPCDHALCNAHLLRELVGLWETTHQTWTQRLASLLRSLKRAKQTAQAAGATGLEPALRARYQACYDRLVARALARNPRPAPTGKRGRRTLGPVRSLLERLDQHRAEVLRFATDFAVPFDNNQAERDLRMVKLQQKTSGCFRSAAGADSFCRIRGYLSTMRKQGHALLGLLTEVCRGTPVWPAGLGG